MLERLLSDDKVWGALVGLVGALFELGRRYLVSRTVRSVVERAVYWNPGDPAQAEHEAHQRLQNEPLARRPIRAKKRVRHELAKQLKKSPG